MTRSKRIFIIAALAAIIAASCGSDPVTVTDGTEPGGSNPAGTSSVDGSWILTDGTVDDTTIAILDDYAVTMVIDGGEVGGRAACNSYGGFVTIDGESFAVEALSWTEMGCEPEPMELEGQFLQGIGLVDTAVVSGDTATLSGEGVRFTFALEPPVPTADLIGPVWVLNTIIQGDTASSTHSSAEPATLQLDADGSFVGSTGCRRISGDYVVTGASLQFPSWGADGTCPTDIESQDNSVVSVIESSVTVTIDGTRLTLTAPGGEGLSYRLEQ